MTFSQKRIHKDVVSTSPPMFSQHSNICSVLYAGPWVHFTKIINFKLANPHFLHISTFCSISIVSWLYFRHSSLSGYCHDRTPFFYTICACPERCVDFDRSEWLARAPTGTTPLPPPMNYYFVHHSEGSHCTTVSRCMTLVTAIQDYHMDSHGG